MITRVLSLGVVFGALLTATGAFAVSPPGAHPAPMAAFEQFVGGEWVGEADVNDGTTATRTVYSWGIAEKVLYVKGFVGPATAEFEKTEQVVYWHPEEHRFKYTLIGRNGRITDGIIEVLPDGSFVYPPVPDPNGSPASVKQVLRFTDADHYVWQVLIQQPGQTEWVLALQEKSERHAKKR
jgi:hypothetical protein